MNGITIKWNNAIYNMHLHIDATIEEFLYKFCERTGMKSDDPALQFITINGFVTLGDTKIFNMYGKYDPVIKIPNQVEYGDVTEQTPHTEAPYMIYIVFNRTLYLLFLPKCALINDIKTFIINITGCPASHHYLKFLKINGCQYENDYKLSKLKNFNNSSIIYLQNYIRKIDKLEEIPNYNFYVVWNNKLFIICIKKVSLVVNLINKIIETTGIPTSHPSLKNLSIEGNTPDLNTCLSNLNIAENSAILLRNIKVPQSEVKELHIMIHLNLQLYVILLKNTSTAEKLKLEVSKATRLLKNHPVVQNMIVNGYSIKNFIFLSDLQLNIETHIYLENTVMYFADDRSITHEVYVHIKIQRFDKTYEMTVPNFITIGSLKQIISSYTRMTADMMYLINLSIDGFLLINDYLILSECTSKSSLEINLNNTILNIAGTNSQNLVDLNQPIEFKIILRKREYRIILKGSNTIRELKEAIHQITRSSVINLGVDRLTINGIVKYDHEQLVTISQDIVTISLDMLFDEVSTTTQIQTPSPKKKFVVIFKNQQHTITISDDHSLAYLMYHMVEILNVPSSHIFFKKLIIAGKLTSVNSILSTLSLKECTIIDVDAAYTLKSVDFMVDLTQDQFNEINTNIAMLITKYKIKQLDNVDPNKKLLVLDLDHTLIDFTAKSCHIKKMLRPHLLEFLTEMYKYYNIILWSATSMKGIKNKINYLSLDENEVFKFLAFVDFKFMTPVNTSSDRSVNVKVKPLMVIWNTFEQFDETNTIMLDDIPTNLILNPLNGIIMRSYFAENFTKDRELSKLTGYLKNLAVTSDNFTKIQHQNWKTSDLL